MTTIIGSNRLKSDLSCPAKHSKFHPHQRWVSISQVCSAFSCLCPGQASTWNVLSFYTWELPYNFQDLDHISLKCSLNSVDRACHPGLPEHRTLISALITQLCCVFTCPLAPQGRRPCLIRICIPRAQPRAPYMFDEQLKERMFIIGKVLIRALYISIAKKCFRQTWFLGVRIKRCPDSSCSVGNSEELPRFRGKAFHLLNRRSGYEVKH